MLFTQFEFVFLFLPIVLFFHERARSVSDRVRLLVIASLVFYAAWDIRFLPMILASVLVNFAFGRRLSRRPKKSLLIAGVVANLLPLVFFKYSVFFFQIAGLKTEPLTELLPGVLPLGISFYTFQQIAYLVDVYKHGEVEREFGKYSFFAVFFPQLIAGPIVHHRDIIPQIGRTVDRPPMFFGGLIYFGIGFVKKFFIADSLAEIADPLFESGTGFDFQSSFVATLSYTFQLYFDFSGYSDMAIGLGKLFGIELPVNFNSPYKARSIVDFWRRWHITLSQFLRDYLYIPLGGNRGGNLKRYRNLLLTMLLGGLWHGAGWAFVLWGAGHGLLLASEHLCRERFPRLRLGVLGYLKTFVLVSLLWVPFRAEDVVTTTNIYLGFLNFQGLAWSSGVAWIVLAAALAICPNSHQIAARMMSVPASIRDYPYTLRFRAFYYLCLTYPIVVAGMCGFYATDLDQAVYTTLPVQRSTTGVSNTEDDFRSNLLMQEVLYGDEQKVVVVGSSFTMQQGCYSFQKDGTAYKSGTLGIGGNSLINGLRTAAAIRDWPNIDTIILGISPLNCGPLKNDCAFPKQGLETLNAWGFDFPQYRQGGMKPVDLGLIDVVQLAFNYRSRRFCQLHGFYHKLATCFASQAVEVTPLDLREQDRFLSRFDEELRLRQSTPTIVESQNGNDAQFEWRDRGILESLRPGGDIYYSLRQLKSSLGAKGIRLVLYETPTPSHEEAPHIYPPEFLESYQIAIRQATSDLEIEYHDLSALLPWTSRCMDDFIHPVIAYRESIHKLLIFRLYGDANGPLAGVPNYRLKIDSKRPSGPFLRLATEQMSEGTRQ